MKNPDAPITREEDLAGYFAAGAKPRARFGVGLEYERFGVHTGTLAPVAYDGERSVRALLERLTQGRSWVPDHENGVLLGAHHDTTRVTLEPGCQLELSGGVHPTLEAARRELSFYLDAIAAASEPLGIAWLGVGMQPLAPLGAIPWLPKKRYAIMRDSWPRRGSRGLVMMKQTACIQVNLDYESEADAMETMRVAMGLSPLVTAAFANSPLTEGRPNGFLSGRAWAWRDTDPDRCGLLPFVFDEGASFDDYLQYALDVPLLFVVRDGEYLPGGGVTFRQWLRDGLDGRRPTLADFERHLTTLFPEVRLKRYLEMRGADSGDPDAVLALAALWKGVLYDPGTRRDAWRLVQDQTFEERVALLDAVCRDGPEALLSRRAGAAGQGPGRARDLIEEIVRLARAGLRAQGHAEEAAWLAPLERRLGKEESCPSQTLLHQWDGEFGHEPRPLVAMLSRHALEVNP
jgi:glutamate--cysteine ligase